LPLYLGVFDRAAFETTVLTLRRRIIHLIVIKITSTMFQRHVTKHLYNVTDFKIFLAALITQSAFVIPT